jgi:hypothetical protein
MTDPRVAPRTATVLPACLLVALTVLAAHFTRVGQFGLYEDDYWSISTQLGAPVEGLWAIARQQFTAWPQGRPLNHLLPPMLGALGSAAGGLTGVYVLAAAWLTLNGLLAYLVARRLVSPQAAIVAAMAYLLFPADSTKPFLTHAAHVQGSMTFLLLGWWLWLAAGWRRALAYPVAGLCLLAYESTFLPFLVVPLFVPVRRSRLLGTWATHLGAVTLLVASIAGVRVAMGEERALSAASHLGTTLQRMTTSLWIGPATSVASFGRGAALGLRSFDPLSLAAAATFVLALLLVLRRAGNPLAGETDVPPAPAMVPDKIRSWQLVGAALVAWSLSYALTIVNYPPNQLMGRLTSTHVAAGWPAALAIAGLFDLLRGPTPWRTRLVVGITAIWLATLVGYHHLLQRGYVSAWQEERRFWRELTLRAPDVGPGWAVVVAGPPRDLNRVILSNSWSDHLIHRQIYSTAPDGSGIGFAHLGFLGSQPVLEREGDAWRWRPEFWGGPLLPIDRARLALFEDDHGALRRVEALETPAGLLRSSAPLPGAPRTSWPDTPVSRLLFPEAFPSPGLSAPTPPRPPGG